MSQAKISIKQKIGIRLIVFKIFLPFYIAIVGMLLSFYCGRNLHLTLINDWLCWGVWAVLGCLITLLLNKYDKKVILFLFLSYSYGAIIMSVLFLANNLFCSANSRQIMQQIVDRSHKKARYPYVTINVGGYVKDIPIDTELKEEIYNSSAIILTVNKGGLGFDTINERQLVK